MAQFEKHDSPLMYIASGKRKYYTVLKEVEPNNP